MGNNGLDVLLERAGTIQDLGAAQALLGWDQETYMPDGAAAARSEQVATISTLVHNIYTSDDVETAISGAESREEWHGDFLREFTRSRDQAVKLPSTFVGEMSRATSIGQHSWRKAREESDFGLFRDDLERIVDIKRRHADYLGFVENPYNALLDIYEPDMSASDLRPVFDRLKEGTIALIDRIDQSDAKPDDSLLYTDFDPDAQLAVSRGIIEDLGFDFRTGRVDLSAHPFCTSFGMTDVRLTTRIYRNDLRSCLFGLIHEAGHGMYEQGIDPRFARTDLAGGTSMGIHESQSLFFENTIARSRAFWDWAFPRLRDAFPDALGQTTAGEFYRMVNAMKPSLIRVEADELTYNLHIILRFEIEDDLINGRLEVKDLPEVWNAKMREYLGVVPSSDAEGVLQDVHWSFGGHGYFPSYTLGKLYAAMFNEQMLSEIPDRESQVAEGDFTATLGWMRKNVHQWGRARTPKQLMSDVCNRTLSEEPFLAYITEKIDDVYGR